MEKLCEHIFGVLTNFMHSLTVCSKISSPVGGWVWGELYKVFGHYMEMEGVIGKQIMLFLIHL